MPVRVRCPQCEKIVNAPDAARGKAVKCPECESRIPVPAGDAEAAPTKPPRPPKPVEKAEGKPKSSKSESAKSSAKPAASKKKSADEDDGDFFGKLDLNRAEDRHAKVCPKCGHEVDEEDVECPACGIDLETGGLGKAARKARMKGPDPADFYPTVWKDAYEFVKENFDLALATWIKLMMLSAITWVMGVGGIFFLISDHKPSFWFFRVLAWLLSVGMIGWFFTMSVKTIQFALEKKSKLDRTPFDAFSSMAMGISWSLWWVVSALPMCLINIPIYFLMKDTPIPILAAIMAGVVALWNLPLIPVVMAHRAMPVNGQIWASPLMWKTAGKCIGAVLFFLMVAFVTFLPVAAIMAGDIFLGRGIFFPIIEAWGIKYDKWTPEVFSGFAEFYSIILVGQTSTGATSAVMSGVWLFLWILVKAILLFALTMWGMFMIRVAAMFTYYNKKYLGLIGEEKQRKYVAKEKKYGADGEPIEDGMSPFMKWLVGVLSTIALYTVVNVILHFSGAGFYLMPKWMAVLLRLTAA